MAYQTKEMEGSLFPNDKKTKGSQPVYTGKVLIRGELLRVAAWVNEYGNDKKKYMSLKFSEWKEKPSDDASGFDAPPMDNTQDEGLPF